ncbi:hypothetical protein DVH05_000699 [Phytophthora capsici]|nr:hypothetical protein DVH05_000699 [Phytophthora capsici]
MVPAGRGWPQSRQKAAVESPNGIRHLAHDVIGICTVPLGATVDREYAELADAPDIAKGEGCPMEAPDNDTPDREIDDLEKPRFSEPLDFFEYSEVGVGFGVEAAEGFEYSEVGVAAAFDLDFFP